MASDGSSQHGSGGSLPKSSAALIPRKKQRIVLTEHDWKMWGGQPRGGWVRGLLYPTECPYTTEFQDPATTDDPEEVSDVIWLIEGAVQKLALIPERYRATVALRLHYGALRGENYEDIPAGKANRWARHYKTTPGEYWNALEWGKWWVQENI